MGIIMNSEIAEQAQREGKIVHFLNKQFHGPITNIEDETITVNNFATTKFKAYKGSTNNAWCFASDILARECEILEKGTPVRNPEPSHGETKESEDQMIRRLVSNVTQANFLDYLAEYTKKFDTNNEFQKKLFGALNTQSNPSPPPSPPPSLLDDFIRERLEGLGWPRTTYGRVENKDKLRLVKDIKKNFPSIETKKQAFVAIAKIVKANVPEPPEPPLPPPETKEDQHFGVCLVTEEDMTEKNSVKIPNCPEPNRYHCSAIINYMWTALKNGSDGSTDAVLANAGKGMFEEYGIDSDGNILGCIAAMTKGIIPVATLIKAVEQAVQSGYSGPLRFSQKVVNGVPPSDEKISPLDIFHLYKQRLLGSMREKHALIVARNDSDAIDRHNAAIQKQKRISDAEEARLRLKVAELKRQGRIEALAKQWRRAEASRSERNSNLLDSFERRIRMMAGQIAAGNHILTDSKETKECPSCGGVMVKADSTCDSLSSHVPDIYKSKSNLGNAWKKGGAPYCRDCGAHAYYSGHRGDRPARNGSKPNNNGRPIKVGLYKVPGSPWADVTKSWPNSFEHGGLRPFSGGNFIKSIRNAYRLGTNNANDPNAYPMEHRRGIRRDDVLDLLGFVTTIYETDGLPGPKMSSEVWINTPGNWFDFDPTPRTDSSDPALQPHSIHSSSGGHEFPTFPTFEEWIEQEDQGWVFVDLAKHPKQQRDIYNAAKKAHNTSSTGETKESLSVWSERNKKKIKERLQAAWGISYEEIPDYAKTPAIKDYYEGRFNEDGIKGGGRKKHNIFKNRKTKRRKTLKKSKK